MNKFLTEEEVDSKEPKRPSFYKLRVFAFMNLYTLLVFFPIFAMTSFLMSYLAGTMEIFLPLMPFLYFLSLILQVPMVADNRMYGFQFLYRICGLDEFYNQYQKWLELVDEYNNQQAAKGYIKKYSDYQ